MDTDLQFEERERSKRLYMIRVVIVEVIMVVSVFVIAVVALLFSMGFFLSEEGKIERSGLVQLHSFPTGASVELDGATLFARTNLSRTLSEGNHLVKLSRAGFDTWEGELKISSGLLLRTFYPRLFATGRSQNNVLDLPQNLEFYSASGTRNFILYAEDNSTTWQLVDISRDDPRTTELDLSKILPGVDDGKFTGAVQEIIWARSNDKILAKINAEEKTSWLWLNLRNINESVNITDTYGLDFTDFRTANDAGTILYALENHNIRRISLPNGDMSRVLINNVEKFDAVGDDILYLSLPEDEKRNISTYKFGEQGSTTIKTVKADDRVLLDLMIYYDASYFTIAVNQQILVMYGSIPSYSAQTSDSVVNEDSTKYQIPTGELFSLLIDHQEIDFTPTKISAYSNGEFVILSNGDSFAALDFEHNHISQYTSPSNTINWLEAGILSKVSADKIQIWDFNNTNHRTLVEYSDSPLITNDTALDTNIIDSVTTKSPYHFASYQPLITSNGRWLYYVVKIDDGLRVIRERII